MALPDLCLLPHEAGDLALDEPLCAPAMRRVRLWEGLGYRDYLLRTLPIRDGHAPSLLVARHEAATPTPLLRLERFAVASAEWKTRDVLARIRQGFFERTLAFDRDGRLVTTRGGAYAALHVSSRGPFIWACEQGNGFFLWSGLNFEQDLTRWRTNVTDAQIEREVAAMLADVDSDCAFAWRWMSLNQRQQERALISVERGTLDEVEAILRAWLWTDEMWQDFDSWEWKVWVGLGSNRQFEFDLGVKWSEIENDSDVYELSPRLQRGLQLVFAHFQLWQNKGASAQKQALRIADGRDTYPWRVPVPIPTAHQQLEARLLLRDFLRDKVSPDELAALMGGA